MNDNIQFNDYQSSQSLRSSSVNVRESKSKNSFLQSKYSFSDPIDMYPDPATYNIKENLGQKSQFLKTSPKFSFGSKTNYHNQFFNNELARNKYGHESPKDQYLPN